MTTNRVENRKKPRRTAYLEPAPDQYYIFCEGEQTEPNYFEGFQKAIESNVLYRNRITVKVVGLGVGTLRVIQAAEAFVREHQLRQAHIWCVYDKDSFPDRDFNAVAERANYLNQAVSGVKYHVAWSNQCIEYWFILHFSYYDADNDRKYYRAYLHKKFAQLGWLRYEKNNDELFNIMTQRGDPKLAIRYAERRLADCAGQTDAAAVPATKVYLLVRELARYLPEALRERYLD